VKGFVAACQSRSFQLLINAAGSGGQCNTIQSIASTILPL
jgi:hypothetical protein